MKIIAALTFAAGLMFLAGCSGEEAQSIANNSARSRTIVITNNGRERTFQKADIRAHSDECNTPHECDQIRAKRITDAVNSVQGVESATVVVYGKKAVVAVELNNGLGYDSLIDFKKLVEHKVKQEDEGITKVVVTTCGGLTPLVPLL